MPALFKCPNCGKLLATRFTVHNCRTQPPQEPPYPFGGVAFDPNRQADEDGIINTERPTNGQNAAHGELILALSCVNESLVPAIRKAKSSPSAKMGQLAELVNLTEAPDEALADLLTNLMHYCHREGIDWFGDDGVSQMALRNFSAESGGAVL